MIRHLARVFSRSFLMFIFGVIVSLSASAQNGNVTYEYDDLGRLKTVTYVDTKVSYGYTYDAAGNRTVHTVDGGLLNEVRLWNGNVFEGGTLCFTVWRPGSSNVETQVRVETYIPASAADYPLDFVESVGTYNEATSGVDYLPLQADLWLTIPPSSTGTPAQFCIKTIEDSDDEPEEHVFARIAEVTNGIVDPSQETAFGRIKDDDGSEVAFHIRNQTVAEPEGYGKKMAFEVLKVGAAQETHAVTVEFTDGTALYGLDYEGAKSCELEFRVEDELLTCEVTLLPDEIYEGGETVIATITSVSGGAVASTPAGQPFQGQGVATGMISDAGDFPQVMIAQNGSKEDGTWGIEHTIWHSKDTSKSITVNYQLCVTDNLISNTECKAANLRGVTASQNDLVPGTAMSGTIVLPATLNADGSPSSADPQGLVTVFPQPDSTEENNEDYAIVLTSISGGARALEDGRWLAYGHIRNDDSADPIFNIWGGETTTGQPLVYTVKRWGNTSGEVRLIFDKTLNKSQVTTPTGVEIDRKSTLAIEGADYTLPASNEIVFPSGVTEVTFSIPTILNTKPEMQGDKFLPIRISMQTGYTGSFAVNERVGIITDDRTQGVTLTQTVTANEAAEVIIFTGAMDYPESVAVDIPYATVPGGTADEDDDYVSSSGVVTVPAGTTTFAIPITIINDTDLNGAETDETLMLNVIPEVVTGSPDPIQATGTILNDLDDGCNATLRVSRSTDNINEFERGTSIDLRQQGGFCTTSASLGGGLTSLTTAMMVMQTGLDTSMHDYQIDLVANSAEEGEDFVAKSVLLSIPGTQQTASIPMEIIDDLLNESTEDLIIRVTPLSGADVSGSGELFIIDDDPGPLYSVSDVTAAENNLLVFTVSKAGQTDLTSSVVYETVDGTAISGEDYSPASGILTFAPAETSKTVVVNGAEDATFELTETFYVDLSQPSVGSALEKARGTATISDNDAVPAFSVSDATAIEGDGIKFAVYLSQPSSLTHSVRAYTFGLSAEDGADYQALDVDLTFAPGETLQYVTIATSDDDTVEPDETFELKITDPTNGAILGDRAGLGTIENDDAPVIDPGPVASSQVFFIPAGSNLNVSMGGGAGGARGIKDGGSGGLGAFELTASNDFYLRVRTGKKGGDDVYDYSPLADVNGGGTTNGAGGQGGGATAISISTDGTSWSPVAIVGAGGGSGSESYGAAGGSLSGIELNGASADGTGAQGDSPGYGGAGSSSSLYNGGNGGAPGQNGQAAYLEFGLPGSGDTVFGIGGGGAGGWYRSGGGGGGRAGGGGGGGYRGAGGGSGYWDVTTWQQIAGATPVITVNQQGGNAGDGFVNFSTTAGNGNPALDPTGRNAPPPPPPQAPSGLVFSISDVTLSEGDKFVFTIAASEPITEAVDLSYSLLDGTALAAGDYTAAAGTLSFAPGDAVKTITIDTVEDAIAEGSEDFSIQLVLASGTATLAKDTGTGTILDDDEAPAFSVSTATPNVVEGQPAFITVSLNRMTENEYSVDYSTVDGTALAGSDYVATSGTLTFTGGEMVKQITVDTIDDLVTGGGTFSLVLSAPTGGATVDSASTAVTIGAYVAPSGQSVLLVEQKVYPKTTTSAVFDFNASLGGGVVGFMGYTTYSNSSTWGPQQLHDTARTSYDWASLTGDASSKFGEWTFPRPVMIDKIFVVPRSQSDQFPSSVTVVVDGVQVLVATGATAIGQSDGLVTNYSGTGYYIQPNVAGTVWRLEFPTAKTYIGEIEFHGGLPVVTTEPGPATVSISVSDASASEGGLLYFTFTALGYSDKEVAVSYDAVSGTATSGGDYTAASGTLYFAPGETEQTIAIQTSTDTALEADETFTLQLAVTAGSGELAAPSAVGTITNVGGELAPVFSVSATPTSLDEGGTVTVTVSKSAATTYSYGVTLATADGTAIAGTHYAALSRVLTFSPTELSKSFTITTVDDAIPDGDRAFTLNLSAPVGGASIGVAEVPVTIIDNDFIPISFSDTEIGPNMTLSSDKLTVTSSGSTAAVFVNTGPISSGKWYWELQPHDSGPNYTHGGIAPGSADPSAQPFYYTSGAYHFFSGTVARSYFAGTGNYYNEIIWGAPVTTSYVAYWLDMDAHTLTACVNGNSCTTISGLATSIVPTVSVSLYTTRNYSVTGRFAPSDFVGTVPTGYRPLSEFGS